MDIKQLLEKEIGDIHKLFEDWYNGKIDKADLNSVIGSRLSEHFYIIFPDAICQSKSDFLSMLLNDHGNDASFKIEIKDIVPQFISDSVFLATYEEWQFWGDKMQPQLRIKTTAIIKWTGSTFEWIAIHETSIP